MRALRLGNGARDAVRRLRAQPGIVQICPGSRRAGCSNLLPSVPRPHGEPIRLKGQLRPRKPAPMPSEKAKENKLLVAQCAACQRVVSVELMTATVIRRKGHAYSVPVCDDCRAKGWMPPEAQDEGSDVVPT